MKIEPKFRSRNCRRAELSLFEAAYGERMRQEGQQGQLQARTNIEPALTQGRRSVVRHGLAP